MKVCYTLFVNQAKLPWFLGPGGRSEPIDAEGYERWNVIDFDSRRWMLNADFGYQMQMLRDHWNFPWHGRFTSAASSVPKHLFRM